ncbi:MAG TPA: MBL fold metallo-hydrolase [Planctomycetota bacterium]|nr:MBL fold metallo-hydrolase [Planctomycetota bacterium]
MIAIKAQRCDGSLVDDVRQAPGATDRVRMWWLGQAGFLVRSGGFLCAIDPYLSGQPRRLMPPAFDPGEPLGLAAVLCSHDHIDHIDPGALPALAEANPGCVFVVPAAARERVLKLGLPEDRLRPARDGDRIELGGGAAVVHVLPSAHEALETDATGAHRALGFVLELGGLRIYHSGDCVPYEGLAARLAVLRPDVALLPANGRDEERHRQGYLGNFSFAEAAELCLASGIGWLVPHHFGMFAGNTVPREELERAAAALPEQLRCLVPEMGVKYEMEAAR